MQQKTFSFFCDESTHLQNDGFPYMIIAYVSSPWNQVKLHSQYILQLREKHRFKGEIKWSKLSESNYLFYNELITYFFNSELNFRAVIVDKSKIDNEKMGFTYNDFYYRMYYQLLHHKIDMEYTYNVYLDIKDTCSHLKNKKIKEILNVQYGNIRNLQFIHSHESVLLQLTDVIMGALNYYLRGEIKVTAKKKIIEKIKKYSNRPLDCSTPRSSEKFNLFFIELKS
ncbi:MAG: DUF3800 domain-containing protein [Bacteroidota bacterium]|nr:DUF3800 domain-containing protein [Bacteroidota bacterium]